MIAFLSSSMFLTSVLPGVASGLLVGALRVSGHPAAKIAARLVPHLVERLRSGDEPAETETPQEPQASRRKAVRRDA